MSTGSRGIPANNLSPPIANHANNKRCHIIPLTYFSQFFLVSGISWRCILIIFPWPPLQPTRWEHVLYFILFYYRHFPPHKKREKFKWWKRFNNRKNDTLPGEKLIPKRRKSSACRFIIFLLSYRLHLHRVCSAAIFFSLRLKIRHNECWHHSSGVLLIFTAIRIFYCHYQCRSCVASWIGNLW